MTIDIGYGEMTLKQHKSEVTLNVEKRLEQKKCWEGSLGNRYIYDIRQYANKVASFISEHPYLFFTATMVISSLPYFGQLPEYCSIASWIFPADITNMSVIKKIGASFIDTLITSSVVKKILPNPIVKENGYLRELTDEYVEEIERLDQSLELTKKSAEIEKNYILTTSSLVIENLQSRLELSKLTRSDERVSALLGSNEAKPEEQD